MIVTLLNEFINAKFDELNTVFPEANLKINQIQTDIDIEDIPANESFINYQTYITSIEQEDFESNIFDRVECKIEFVFLIANKNIDIYKTVFDRYLYAMRRLIKNTRVPLTSWSDDDISLSISINEILGVTLNNADRFDDEYFKPTIEFTLRIADEIEITNLNKIYKATSTTT